MDINTFSERKKNFYSHFEKLSKTYPKYKNRFKYYWKLIIRQCNYFITSDSSVLEIGCGTGETLVRLNGSRKVGLDFSAGMINIARENFPDLEFIIQDAENITLDEKFDVIVLNNVIGYFDDVQKVFSSLHKVCHNRTKIVIVYYNYLWEPILKLGELLGIKKRSYKQNWLSNHDIKNLLYLANLDPYKFQLQTLIPIYIPVISYFFNKIIARLPLLDNFCINQFIYARPVGEIEDGEEYQTSIVVPARNESGNVEDAILRTPNFGKSIELIFIEGGSTDDTWEKIKEMQHKYPDKNIKIGQQDGKGKGNAVRKGFDMATGDILMILDADLTVPPEDLPKFYDALSNGKGDFINGARLVYPMEKRAMRFLNLLGNKFFSMLFSWLLAQPIKDTLCGTKVLFKKDYEKLIANRSFFGNFDPFGDFDLLFGAYKLNLKIIDLPIRYRERLYGDTNISRFKHGFILLKMSAYAARKIKFY